MLFAQWEEVAEWLSDAEAVTSPAELQAHLTGRVVAGETLQGKRAMHVLEDFLAVEPELLMENESIWVGFAGSIQSQVEDNQFGYVLLLPDDSTPLPFRLLALGQWCQGFLGGVGSVVKELDKSLDKDAREILKDMAEIAQISTDEQETDENEFLFVELVEFVRVSIFTLATSLRGQPAAKTPPALH